MKKLLLFSILAVLSCACYPQYYQKKIKCKNQDYVHGKTGLSFPVELEGLGRESIYAFDRKKDNVGANYEDGQLKVSVYVYPTGDGYEDRLRRSFVNCLAAVSASDHFAVQKFEMDYTSFHSGKHLIHGYRSVFRHRDKFSLLSLYECGQWWLKFRISSASSDADKLIAAEEKLRTDFDAGAMIESAPLSNVFSLYFQKTAYCDSLMLGCVMGGAFAKTEWMRENVDSLELCAGIPSVYLEYYMAGFNGMLKFANEHPEFVPSAKTKKMVENLKAVAEAGYLREFIADNRTVIAKSDSAILDMDGYYNWTKEHPMMNEELFFDHAIVSNKPQKDDEKK